MKIINLTAARFLLAMTFFCLVFMANAQPPGTGWAVSYADEFSGNTLNESRWRIRTNGVFTRSSVQVGNGVLRLTNTYKSNGTIEGGWVDSKQKFAGSGNIKYGYYEARVRITSDPNGSIWPTWWIWGNRANNVTTTEIDVMEYSGFSQKWFNNRATSSHHYHGKYKIDGVSGTTTSANNVLQRNPFEWHKWGILWTPTELTFYYDGQPYMSSAQPQDAANANNPLALIFSTSPHTINADPEQPDNPTAANAAKPGQNLPSFEVDYVRVYTGGTVGGGSSGAPVGKTIALRKSGGDRKYVTAEQSANDSQLIARGGSIQAWEKFNVENHPAGGVALKALSNGKYIQVNNTNQGIAVKAKGNSKLDWEQFQWKSKGANAVALKSMHSNKWLQCSWNVNNAVMYPAGGQDLTWETFDYTVLGNARRDFGADQTVSGAEMSVVAYPNPLGDSRALELDVIVPEQGNLEVRIFNINGQEVFKNNYLNVAEGGHTISIDVDQIKLVNKGVYMVRVTSGSRTQNIRMIY